MILLDKSSGKSNLIGMQKSNKRYTFLHWDISGGLFAGSEYSVMIAGSYENIIGIGPTTLVEWVE